MPSRPTPAPAKCESKSGHVHGHRNSPSIAPLRYPRQNERASSERAIKRRGAGGIPPRLFASGLSLEKAWIPARDRAGRTTPQVPTCAGPNLDHLPTAKPPPLSKLALSRLECQGLQFGHNIQKTSSQNGGILLVQRLTGASWEPPGKRQPSCCVPHIL